MSQDSFGSKSVSSKDKRKGFAKSKAQTVIDEEGKEEDDFANESDDEYGDFRM